MTPIEWLSQPMRPNSYPVPGADEPTRLQVYAMLVAVNGGREVRGWGVQVGCGLYGRSGLDQDEALALMQLDAFVCGMLEAGGGAESVRLAMSFEIDRVRSLRDR